MNKKVLKSVNKVVANRNRQVKKDNLAFEKMSPAEKRVQIARDCLQQLASKRLVATQGSWLTGVNDISLFSNKDVKKDLELQQVLLKQKKCEACALGGMFMCAVERADKLKLSKIVSTKGFYYSDSDQYENCSIEQSDVFSYMRKFFSKDQLELIEFTFEHGNGACYLNNDKASAAIEFSYKANLSGDSQTLMKLIMENIVVNKGTFKPEKVPVQQWVTPGYVG